MAETFKLTTVTASIAAQSVTVTNVKGASVTLSIRDIDNLPANGVVNQDACPMLAPKAGGFLSDYHFTRDSLGADAAYKTVEYTLHYILWFAPIAQGETLLKNFDDFLACAAAVLLYFETNTNLNGTTDFMPLAVPALGGMTDANGTLFHACQISFRVTQFTEA